MFILLFSLLYVLEVFTIKKLTKIKFKKEHSKDCMTWNNLFTPQHYVQKAEIKMLCVQGFQLCDWYVQKGKRINKKEMSSGGG